ncbi:MAG: hypothetical protein RSF90_01995 [Pygmaiobacter sp.]
MKKLISIFALLLMVLSLCTACSPQYKDGVYHAEFSAFDEHGWKEYVDVQVADGKVIVLTFDGVNVESKKKSEDEASRSNMEPVEGTYPAKFYADITNQYLESGKLKDVDTVAGATVSTDNFKTLMNALDKNMKDGTTAVLIVEQSVNSK